MIRRQQQELFDPFKGIDLEVYIHQIVKYIKSSDFQLIEFQLQSSSYII